MQGLRTRSLFGALIAAVVIFGSLCATSVAADELRGWWIDAWHAGFLNQSQVDKLLGVPGNASSVGDIRNANLNAVFVQVRRRADTCYPSGMGEPYFSSGLSPSNFNALQAIIRAAHDTTGGKQRIEVHAWMVTFATAGGAVYSRHCDPSDPDNYWVTLDSSGNETDDQAFDPGHPKCEEYIVGVAMDLVNNFDIDGIHFDYIRFTGSNQGYNPTSIARYNTLNGTTGQPSATSSTFKQWRRDQITAVVRKTYAKIQASKPNVKLSGALFTSTPAPTSSTRAAFQNAPAYTTIFCDWDSWLQEGIMDMAVPMTYFESGTDNTNWIKWTSFEKDRKGNRHMIIGPGLYLNSQTDAISQLLDTRTASAAGNYANGFSGYDYYTPYDGGSWSTSWVSALTSQVTPSKTNIPTMPWKSAPTKGHISGTVTLSANGAWADGVNGTIVNISGPESRSMRCDGTGFYAFIDLTPGTYTVTASRPGFPSVSKTVKVAIGAVTGNMYVTDFSVGKNVAPSITDIQATAAATSATITWTTNTGATTAVNYGLDSSYGSQQADSTLATSHSVTLTGLTPMTTYHFQCVSTNPTGTTASDDYTFTTTPTVTEIEVDNSDAGWTNISPNGNTWTTGSTTGIPMIKSGYLTAACETSTTDTANTRRCRWTPNLPAPGYYDVYVFYQRGANRTTAAPYTITYYGGQTTKLMDQSGTTSASTYVLAASNLPFVAGTNGYVELSTLGTGSTGVVDADAVKWVYKSPIDLTPPTATISAPTASATRMGPVEYTVSYDGADSISLSANDIILNRTGTADGSVSISGSGTTSRTVTISSITGSGTLGISIAAGSASDSSGNQALAVGPSQTFVVDNSAPTIAISAPSAASSRGDAVTYTVSYTGASSIGLSTASITLNKTGTATGTVSVSGSSADSRTVTISSITGEGTLGISIASNTAYDSVGNGAAATGPSATFAVDTIAPTISVGARSASLTRSGPVTYTVTYTGASSVTLSAKDVTLITSGTATGSVSVSGTGTDTRTITISSITGDGMIRPSVAAGTGSDAAGNTTPAASAGSSFGVDNTPPTVVIDAPSTTSTQSGPVTFAVNYSGAGTVNLSASSITLNKTGSANGTIAVSGTGTASRTVTVSSITGSGTLGISIAAGTAGDAAGNTAAAAGPSATFSVDNSAPTMSSVTDEVYTISTTSLQASWSAADSDVASYEYAVGSTAGATDVKPWTGAGTSTSATISNLSLTVGSKYYISVRATDTSGLTSAPLSSAGVRVARPVASIQEAKALTDGEAIALPPLSVTAKFADRFYIEEEDRISGIRVQSSEAVTIGQSVTIYGIIGLADGCERAILIPKVISGNIGAAAKPLFMTGASVGGAALGSTPGITDGVGLCNVGLLVRLAGKVGAVVSDGFYLDDGSKVADFTGNTGIKIWTGSGTVAWPRVTVTGVISLRSQGGKVYAVVLARDVTGL